MKSEYLKSRLSKLPMRHKFIACAGAAIVASGFAAILLTRPSEYRSSALFSYTAPSETRAPNGIAPATLTANILTADAIASSFAPAGLNVNPYEGEDAASLRSHLSISDVPPSRVRVTWTGRDAQQTRDAEKALTYLLTSWAPSSALQETLLKRLPKQVEQDQADSAASPAASPAQAREAALLRVTVAMIDVKTAELNAQLDNSAKLDKLDEQAHPHNNKNDHERRSSLEAQIKRYQAEKQVVLRRLAEAVGELPRPLSLTAAHTQPVDLSTTRSGKSSQLRLSTALQANGSADPISSAANLASNVTTGKPFNVLQQDVNAQPVNGLSWQLVALSILNGVAFGLFYLAAALWRFRPIRSVASLHTLLPGHNLLVGTIAEIKH